MSLLVVQAGSSAHRRCRVVVGLLGVLVLVAVPFTLMGTLSPEIFGKKFTIGLDNLLYAMSWMVAILGLNLLVGFNGQVSLGNSFFVGTGAYVSAILIVERGWPFIATLAVVVPLCFLLGVLVGLPALKIKGLYLALITVVMASTFPIIVRLDSLVDHTGGSNGLNAAIGYPPPSWVPLTGVAEFLQGIPLIGGAFGSGGISDREAEKVWRYVLVVLLTAFMFWTARNIISSRVGRAWIAIRDNETGAAVSGVNVRVHKTLAFGVSAVYGGVGGALYTLAIGALAPDSFSVFLAIFLIVGLVVGGVGTLTGPVIGGLFIIFIPHWSGQWASQAHSFGPFTVTGDRPYGTVILGVVLIGAMFLMPGGVASGLRRLTRRFVRVEPPPPPVHDRQPESRGDPAPVTRAIPATAGAS